MAPTHDHVNPRGPYCTPGAGSQVTEAPKVGDDRGEGWPLWVSMQKRSNEDMGLAIWEDAKVDLVFGGEE